MSSTCRVSVLGTTFFGCLMIMTAHAQVMAEAPLRIRLYLSLHPRTTAKRAAALRRPLAQSLERELQYPIDFRSAEGETVRDLFRFAKELNEGTIHVGITCGLEYGWLRKKFPQIKPLAVGSNDGERLRALLMVHERFSSEGWRSLLIPAWLMHG